MPIGKVRTHICTQDQLAELQKLGCEETPYITFPHELIFKAMIDDNEQLDALRALSFVTWVGPMPTYSVL